LTGGGYWTGERPVSKPPVLRTISRVRFRVSRAARDWNAALEILAEAAQAPGYCGPDLAILERVAAEIAAIQKELLRDWPRRLCGLEDQ
jgi:hypothetical protein